MFAYVDGTTGGMILQIFLGSLVGGLLIFKLALKSLVRAIFHRKPSLDDRPEVQSKSTISEERPLQ